MGTIGLDAAFEDVLAHHGIKGMKWGVRRERPHAVTVTERPGNRTVKTSGGHEYKATGDAKRTAKSKQVAKKNSTDALTTKQLKEAVERMRLEQQFKELSTPKNGVQAWIKKDFKQNGNKRIGQLGQAGRVVAANLKVAAY